MRRVRLFSVVGVVMTLALLVGGWMSADLELLMQPSPSPWLYTALGDSIASGEGASAGYVPRYQRALESQLGAPVEVTNLACGGCKTGDLLSQLKGDLRFREAVAQSQIVTWDIGGNDLLAARGAFLQGACGGPNGEACLRAAVQDFETNWDAILAEIVSLTSGRPVLVVTMDIYDPFVRDGAPGDLAVFLPYLNRVNGHIAATTAANGVLTAPVHEAFNGPGRREDPSLKGFIGSDPIHPTDAGHQRIADLLVEVGRGALEQLRSQPLPTEVGTDPPSPHLGRS